MPSLLKVFFVFTPIPIQPFFPMLVSLASHPSIRDAAEDTSRAMMVLVNTHAICMVVPVLFKAFAATEWRIKENALQRLAQLASLSPLDISVLLPKILPKITPMVWDTKAQVSKCASKTILECCNTNLNPDVKSAIPAVVAAICKPSETVKAIEKVSEGGGGARSKLGRMRNNIYLLTARHAPTRRS